VVWKATHACNKCGAPIRWVTTPRGRRAPLDESSDPNGRWIYTGKNTAEQLEKWEAERHRIDIATGQTRQLLFQHHFATCPAARPQPEVPEDAIQRAYDVLKKRDRRAS
jgi:hypothetical protein